MSKRKWIVLAIPTNILLITQIFPDILHNHTIKIIPFGQKVYFRKGKKFFFSFNQMDDVTLSDPFGF